MSEEADRSEREGWREDEWVARLVTDPAEVPEVQVIAGFLGRSDRPGHWRLYLTPRLDEYIECREQDVLHMQKVGQQAPLGGSMVWLDRKATVRRTQLGGPEAQAEFLQGDITTEFLSTARLQAGGVESDLALWTIVIRISRRICPRPSSRGPCTVPSLCNTCPTLA